MVLDSVAQRRPKRQAALKGVQNATRALTERKSDQPKSGSLAKKKSVRKSAVTVEAASSSGSDLTEEDEEDEESVEQSGSEDDEEEEQDNYRPSKKGRGHEKQRKGVDAQNTRARPKKQAKVPTSKATSKQKTPRQRKPKTPAAVVPGRARRGGGSKDDLAIESDNVLFNAAKDPAKHDLRSIAEEWMSFYQDKRPCALAQFMNFVLRACGSNSTLDEVQVEDIDNIVDMLNDAQQEFKKQNLPSYPLVSRSSSFRRFRRSLSELLEHIFTAASEADVLDDECLIDTLIAWISAMSSSPYRALRHTATTFALMMMGQIARLNQAARKVFEQASKARDAEKAAKADGQRVKALNEQVRQANTTRQLLDAYHRELDEAVFTHRYRDSDPTIRADCMEELGRWMRMCPAQFLSSRSLSYFAWELSDESATVRLVVVQALSAIYGLQQRSSALETFSERMLSRMIEIATGDVDSGVRIAMVQTLLHLDQLFPIDEEEQRDMLAVHIFDADVKVRNAFARFVANMIEEQVSSEDEAEADKARFKSMGNLLARLDAQAGVEKDNRPHYVEGASVESRTALAVGALWTVSEKLRSWKPLLGLLQVDHSNRQSVNGQKKRGGEKQKNSREVDLSPVEEAILVESLVVLLQKEKEASAQASVEAASMRDEMSKDLMSALPILFNKYKTEEGRIGEILILPKHMNLSLYLEYGQTTAYDMLWDNVIDQFQRHTEITIAERSVEAMASLASNASMSDANEIKLQHLREQTISAMKDSVTSFAQLSGMRNLLQDDLHRLTACTIRLRALYRRFDLTASIDESEDESQSGIWDILLTSAQRASLNRAEERPLIVNAIVILALYTMWKTRSIVQMDAGQLKATAAEDLLTKRQALLAFYERTLESESTDDAISEIQKEALCHTLDIYIMYANLHAADEQRAIADSDSQAKLPEPLQLACSAATQETLASFVAKETQRFCQWLQKQERSVLQDANQDEAVNDVPSQTSFAFLQVQHDFVSTVSHFIGAIRLGVLDIRLSASMLAYFGHLGVLFDACLRVLIDGVREVGIHERQANVACQILFVTLKQAYAFVEQEPERENTFVSLAKMLSSCLVLRGTQLAILKSVDGRAVVRLHELCIEWIAERLQDADGQTNSSPQGLHALTMFKAISQLLVSVQPREAIAIKASLQRVFTEHNVDFPPTSDKAWDALHSYERRLVTIASKSEAVARQLSSSVVRPKTTDTRSSRRDNEMEDADDHHDDDLAPSSPTPATHGRPRPRARTHVASTQESIMAKGRAFTTSQQDERQVDSLLGDDSTMFAGLQGENEVDESVAGIEGDALSMPAFDLSQATNSSREASQMLFRGLPDISQSQQRHEQRGARNRPTRRARPSTSFAESDDEDEGTSREFRRKRSRRS